MEQTFVNVISYTSWNLFPPLKSIIIICTLDYCVRQREFIIHSCAAFHTHCYPSLLIKENKEMLMMTVQYIKYDSDFYCHTVYCFLPLYLSPLCFISYHQLWSVSTETVSPSEGLHKSLLISPWMKRQAQNLNQHWANPDCSQA